MTEVKCRSETKFENIRSDDFFFEQATLARSQFSLAPCSGSRVIQAGRPKVPTGSECTTTCCHHRQFQRSPAGAGIRFDLWLILGLRFWARGRSRSRCMECFGHPPYRRNIFHGTGRKPVPEHHLIKKRDNEISVSEAIFSSLLN